MLNNTDKSHVKRAKEFCKKHEQLYTHHKCKPIWDKDGNLELSQYGLKNLSLRVRAGRNLSKYPLPGAMTK